MLSFSNLFNRVLNDFVFIDIGVLLTRGQLPEISQALHLFHK